jgi:hypothetical protein
MAAIKEAGQTITFCGVNAHFQNAVAERRIRALQDQARTMLIHAQHRWPCPRQLMLISGLMLSGLQMKFITPQPLWEEKISSHHLSCLPSLKSLLTSITFNLLDVLSLSLTTRCNLERSFPSGRSDQGWVSTWECQCSMQGVWL